MAVTLYGIKTCDTIRKARAWLNGHGVAHRFHDFRVDGFDPATLKSWIKSVGWEILLNRSSTSFRALTEAQKSGIDQAKAQALMLTEPTMIKRPVLDSEGTLTVGFKPEVYAGLFVV